MLDALRAFLDEISGAPSRPRPFEASDHRLAAAALLVHLAAIDGVYDVGEKQLLHRLVETRFGLDPAAAGALIAAAAESERDAVDLYRFTSVLKRTLDEEGRRAVIAMLWEMAYADGTIHEFEENVIWRVAELLGVSTRDRVELRQAAKDAGKPITPGPWGG
ncbi:TerB family tellurite resistance protein [Methylosinus sp. Sm6]|uniref:tellurite resistance TerB family protein n=1 Tax=Methylosinus sp. Sm6 TaxID=2866948 RepID=UPI001C99E40F|nr:TerB family tellurite resistance protein [Methylosinus sp. Sm6]MBY6242491.1 TerB family tellurite resistance protein [Methylosinus sp. Sm6]